MINFFVNDAGSFGIRNYLGARGAELADRVQVHLYEALDSLTTMPATGTIFAALDQAGPAALRAAAAIGAALDRSPAAPRVLNRPDRALGRHALLARLYESKRNRFQAIRADEDPRPLRYPVFIRFEHRHVGSLTPLLADRAALDAALAELVVRGLSPAELLIVEFCDTAGPDGLYRKYSAMRIGDTIVPRHLHVSPAWMSKAHNSVVDESLVREEMHYVDTNPHAAWLAEVFDLAGIDYGRVDYGVWRGEPQVWEINMNPTFGRGARRSSREGFRELLEPGRVAANRRLLAALGALETPAPAAMPVVFDAGFRVELAAEGRARLAGSRRALVSRVIRDRGLSRVLRTVFRPAWRHVAPVVARLSRQRA